jgi:hypothetical protein
MVLPAQGGSEMCHFCNKRVYLMEKLSADGKSFHRGCFRCEYCSISLRIGNISDIFFFIYFSYHLFCNILFCKNPIFYVRRINHSNLRQIFRK